MIADDKQAAYAEKRRIHTDRLRQEAPLEGKGPPAPEPRPAPAALAAAGAVLLAVLAPLHARAQTTATTLSYQSECMASGVDQGFEPVPYHALTGDHALDDAMRMCDDHQVALGPNVTLPATIGPVTVGETFGPGWGACRKVLAAWTASDAAQQQKARLAQAAADLKTVNDFAAKLP